MKALLAPLLLLALLGTAPTKPYIFTPNTPAQSAQVNADFDILYNAFQNVDNTNVGPAGFFASQIAPLNTAQATVGGTVPLLFPNGLLANTPTVYNVKSPPFNAYGDNVHDDTSAIQTAITSAAAVGGTVFIPPGTYRTSAAFVVDNIGNSGGVIIEGAGMGLYGACLPA